MEGRGEPWEGWAPHFTSNRADLLARMALVISFPPRSQEGSLERHVRTLLLLWRKKDHLGVSQQLQYKTLRCLGLAKKADTKATGPDCSLYVLGVCPPCLYLSR